MARLSPAAVDHVGDGIFDHHRPLQPFGHPGVRQATLADLVDAHLCGLEHRNLHCCSPIWAGRNCCGLRGARLVAVPPVRRSFAAYPVVSRAAIRAGTRPRAHGLGGDGCGSRSGLARGATDVALAAPRRADLAGGNCLSGSCRRAGARGGVADMAADYGAAPEVWSGRSQGLARACGLSGLTDSQAIDRSSTDVRRRGSVWSQKVDQLASGTLDVVVGDVGDNGEDSAARQREDWKEVRLKSELGPSWL